MSQPRITANVERCVEQTIRSLNKIPLEPPYTVADVVVEIAEYIFHPDNEPEVYEMLNPGVTDYMAEQVRIRLGL